MKYHVNFPNGKGYVLAKITGFVEISSLLNCLIEAHAMARQRKVNCCLMDLTDARNLLTTLENYHFAYTDMNHPGIDRRLHIAMLVNPDDHSHDFLETLARNNGRDMTIFTSLAAAERYLSAAFVPSDAES